MIWFICPFSREDQSEHIEKIWKSQTINCNLIVIANGCKYNGDATVVINLKEKGAVPALNAGLEYLRQHDSDGIWARLDDDDEYAPGYLEDVSLSLQQADWSGISVANIKLLDGDIIKSGSESLEVGSGGTLACKIRHGINFEDCFPIEDARWCSMMKRKGFKYQRRSSRYYKRIRHTGCHSPMTDDQFRLFGVCP